MKEKHVQFYIGVNPIVFKNGKLLLGKRKNIFGDKTWGLPGGHLEINESIEKCASRELYEETGLICNNFKINNIVSQFQKNGKNYLQIGLETKKIKGNSFVKEPEKCYELKWFSLAKLPKNIFENHKEQINIFIKNL